LLGKNSKTGRGKKVGGNIDLQTAAKHPSLKGEGNGREVSTESQVLYCGKGGEGGQIRLQWVFDRGNQKVAVIDGEAKD